MTVGILGLGLIGGSLARAYAIAGHTVYATQRNEDMLSFAMLLGRLEIFPLIIALTPRTWTKK